MINVRFINRYKFNDKKNKNTNLYNRFYILFIYNKKDLKSVFG
jgi:hypothetical protein